MADENGNEKVNCGGYFIENPPPHIPHVRNYMKYLGNILCRYRQQLPREERTAQQMADRVSAYTGTTVTRQRVTRAENGDEIISIAVYAAILDQMNAWPDIIWALEKGDASCTQFARLIVRELSDDISKAHKDGLKRLRNKKMRQDMGLS